MRTPKTVEEHLQEGTIKKITPDHNRAENLRREATRKYRKLHKTIETQGIEEEDSNDYLEDRYNIIMQLIRAHMLEQGYNSTGRGAHEAEIAYAKKLGLQEQELETLDQLRYLRNGILYYGKTNDKEYAQKIIDYTEKFYQDNQHTNPPEPE